MSDLPPQLEPANAIHDPVHGRVWLTGLEIELINTPEFQRLRSIGQLTPVDLVFPGATHNRFAHSIGTAHVMGMILRQKSMQEYFTDGREELVPLLRLAALLHDVGHLPFSHVGEMAWGAAGTQGIFDYADSPNTSVFDVAASAKASALHEDLSELLIQHSRLGDVIDRALPAHDGDSASTVVSRIVAGHDTDPIVRNLLSSDLDCDRLDYLLRDSLTAGLVYGNIDLSYLIGNLLVGRDEHDNPLLAIERKHGLLAGEHFLLARYYHYAQFISHKTVASAEVALVAGMLELIRLGELPCAADLTKAETDTRVKHLLTLTDARVLCALADAPSRHAGEHELVEAARRIGERKLLKSAARHECLEARRVAGDPQAHSWDTRLRRPQDKLRVAEECNIEPSSFCYRQSSRPLTGIEGDFTAATAADAELAARSMLKAAKVSSGGAPPKLLISESAILKPVWNKQWATRRVFFREPLENYEPRVVSQEFTRLSEYLDRDLSES